MNLHLYGLLWLLSALFVGLINCFFGYRLFIIIVAFLGLVIGASVGYLVGDWLGGTILTFGLSIVLGLIGAWAAVSGYYAFIFVAGAFGAALFAAAVGGFFSEDVPVLLLLLLGLIGGFTALWLQRTVIILATAAQGAVASIFAAVAIASGGGVAGYRQLFYRLFDGDLPGRGGIWFYLGAFLWLLLFSAGLVAQFTRGKEMYKHPRRREAEPRG